MTQAVLLGDIADIQTGPFGSQLHQEDYVDKGTPIITVEHLGGDRITTQNLPRVSDDDKQRLSKYWMREGDTIFSRVGSVDRASYVHQEEDGWLFSGRCLRVRPDAEKVTPRYLSFVLRSPQFTSYIKSIAVGATMPSINTKLLSTAPVALIPRDAQEKVVATLDAIEQKIELNRQMHETLEQIGQALFRHYFIDNPEVEKWESGILSDIIDINPRESIKKGSVVTYLEMKNMPESGMSIKGAEARAFTSGMKFRNGDTLLARITPCLENGKTAFVDFLGEDEVGFGSTEYIVMRPKYTELTEYVYYLARSDAFRAHAIQSMIGTSGRQRVQNDLIVAYPVTKPASDLLAEFHKKMEVSFAQIRNNAQQIQTLTTLRDILLPRLISGKVKV